GDEPGARASWATRCGLSRRGHVPHQRTDRPGQRLLVAVEGIVVSRPSALDLALLLVIPVAVHAVDQLAQHARIHPAIALGWGEEPGLHVINPPAGLVDGQWAQRPGKFGGDSSARLAMWV